MKIDLFYNEADKSTEFSLLEDVCFTYLGETYEIPSGFCSDGGSIPRAFWNILEPLDGRYILAYCIHDYLYAQKIGTRKDADELLRELLKEAGMSMLRRNEVYWAVRAFGGSHWR